MEKHLHDIEALKKLKHIAEDVRVCMFATQDENSYMYGRPMGTAHVDDDGTIWFFTNDSSSVAKQGANNDTVTLHYSHPGKNSYMTVVGDAEMTHDKDKMEKFWNPMLKAWFPDGIETPGISLLRVTPSSAHYWDNDAAKVKIMFSAIKAAVTGSPAKGSEGHSGELDIR